MMAHPVDVRVFFNFRSPYCYLASKSLWEMLDAYNTNLVWRPLGGWNGRSPPERAKKKVPLARQDLARWAKRMGIPANPPPQTTDPTRAGAVSLLAEESGVLHQFVVRTMAAEWADEQLRLPSPEQRRPQRFLPTRRRTSSGANG